MKRLGWILLVAGCSSAPSQQPTDQEREIRRAFEAWCAHIVAGRVEEVYRGMSVMMISEWLYLRLGDAEEPVMRKFRSQLAQDAGEEIDVWYVTNKSRNADRATPLPIVVLNHPALYQCFATYFEPLRERMKHEFSRVEVAQVYADVTGATVVVRNKAFGGNDRYMMVYEGGWKVDHHAEPGALLAK